MIVLSAVFVSLMKWFDSQFAKNHPLSALVLYPFFFSMASDLPPPPEPTVAQLFALILEEREAADRKSVV